MLFFSSFDCVSMQKKMKMKMNTKTVLSIHLWFCTWHYDIYLFPCFLNFVFTECKHKHSGDRAQKPLKLIRSNDDAKWKVGKIKLENYRPIESICGDETANLATNQFITSHRHCSHTKMPIRIMGTFIFIIVSLSLNQINLAATL